MAIHGWFIQISTFCPQISAWSWEVCTPWKCRLGDKVVTALRTTRQLHFQGGFQGGKCVCLIWGCAYIVDKQVTSQLGVCLLCQDESTGRWYSWGFWDYLRESKDRACECQDLAKCFILINLIQQFYGSSFIFLLLQMRNLGLREIK